MCSGGKSPVYICDSADVEKTAKRQEPRDQ